MDATSEGEVDPAIPQSGRPAREKDVEAFRTISEVADDLRLPQHVLRFWETRFPQLRPLKRAGGRRYYRPGDIALLRTIRDLLHNEGYTIKGVQRLLRERRSPRGTASDPAIGEAGEMLSEDAPTDLVDPPVADAEHASDVGAPSLGHHTPSAAGPDARLAAEPVAAIAQALRVIEDCERLLRVALSAGS